MADPVAFVTDLEVVAVARKLEEEGLITTGGSAGEAYVV